MRSTRFQIAAVTLVIAGAMTAASEAQVTARARTRHGAGTVIISNGERTDTINIGGRGRMGINVDMRPDPATDSIGARVAGTTPDGPAYRAGVQVGDLVTRFNGTALGVTERSEDDDQSRPAMRLINLASRLNRGDTVHLDLRRGAQNQSVTLVAAETGVDDIMMNFPGGGDMLMGPMTGMREPLMRGFSLMAGPLSSLELVRINPGLGEYFGTQEGLLVVSAGDDSSLGLRSGDVILSIGGRHAASPPQAMRILGTYEPNETVQFEIMRQKHRQSVSGKIPQRSERRWRIEPDMFEFEKLAPEFDGARKRFEIELPRMQREFHNFMLPRSHVRTIVQTEET